MLAPDVLAPSSNRLRQWTDPQAPLQQRSSVTDMMPRMPVRTGFLATRRYDDAGSATAARSPTPDSGLHRNGLLVAAAEEDAEGSSGASMRRNDAQTKFLRDAIDPQEGGLCEDLSDERLWRIKLMDGGYL